jgi:predicted MFS family arabinose efflux permease
MTLYPGQRSFHRLLTMQVPADMADWLDMVAIGALLAFTWKAPPVAFAWLAVAMALPPLTIGVLAGVYVDRWPLRRTLVLANLGRCLATAALILVSDWPTLVAVVALRATADSAFGPAKQVALQRLVPPDKLVSANGLSQGINQATKVAAPAVGAVLLAFLDPRQIFAANAALSGLAMLLVLALPPLGRATIYAQPSRFLDELRSGLRVLAGAPVLRSAVLLMFGSTFAVFAYDTQVPPLLQVLGQSKEALGFCIAAVGAGGILGSFGVMGLSDRVPPQMVVAVAIAVAALLVAALGIAELRGQHAALAPLLALFAVVGLASSLARVPLRATIQRETPPGLMGRVAALVEAAGVSALLLAPFCGAALATAISVGAAFVAGAAVMLAVAVVALRLL